MMKKAWCGLVALVYMLSFAATTAMAYTIGDSDIEVPWAAEQAEVLGTLGLLRGTENGYELDRRVTRAEAAVLVVRMAGEENAAHQAEGTFRDVPPEHWGAGPIAYGVRRGYLNGTGDAAFEPERDVTGREFAKMLLGAMGYENLTLENVYEMGVQAGLLADDAGRLAVSAAAYPMLRNDVVMLCCDALLAQTADGGSLRDVLVKKGAITREQADGLDAPSATSKPSEPLVRLTDDSPVAWRLRAYMPKEENYIYSPLSLELAVAMAANGAEDETREQLMKLLPDQELDGYNDAAKKLMEAYGGNEGVTLELANSIWLNADHKSKAVFQDEYVKLIEAFYNGTARDVNRKNAVQTINGWVKERTHGKIDSIIDQKLVDKPEFLACLINSLYFKGQWQSQFSERQTKKNNFTGRDGETSELDFMDQTSRFAYYEDENLQMVRLPYEGGTVSMYVALTDVESIDFEHYIDRMAAAKVRVQLPKFKTKFTKSLTGVVKDMGITRAFDQVAAQFGPMIRFPLSTEDWNAFIMDIIQKAYIEVDENGTEAAAVTMVGMGGSPTSVGTPELIYQFKADRPFVYFIRDEVNHKILFVGEYAYAK